MARPDGIEALQGCAPWVHLAHHTAGLLAAAAILISSASLFVQGVLLGGLLAVHLAAAHRMYRATREVHRVRFFDDGTASILGRTGAIPALLQNGVWTSRWISVARLRPLDGRRSLPCTFCRSANSDDAYRRLLILLRHHAVPDSAARRRAS